MSQGKHTPPPFQLGSEDFDGDPLYVNIYAEGEEKFIGLVSSEDVGLEEARANAALWVAAPDLLAACEAALDLLQQSSGSEQFSGSETIEEYLGLAGGTYTGRLLREAIAKAKGGEHGE